MFNKEDILAALANGKSIEEIAQAAADALNGAKEQYDREQAAKREAEAIAAKKAAEAAALQKKKEEKAGGIMQALFDYLNTYHAGFFTEDEKAEFNKAFNPAALVEAIDETVNIIKSIPSVAEQMKQAPVGGPFQFSVQLNNKEAKEVEDAIQKFLKENHLF